MMSSSVLMSWTEFWAGYTKISVSEHSSTDLTIIVLECQEAETAAKLECNTGSKEGSITNTKTYAYSTNSDFYQQPIPDNYIAETAQTNVQSKECKGTKEPGDPIKKEVSKLSFTHGEKTKMKTLEALRKEKSLIKGENELVMQDKLSRVPSRGKVSESVQCDMFEGKQYLERKQQKNVSRIKLQSRDGLRPRKFQQEAYSCNRHILVQEKNDLNNSALSKTTSNPGSGDSYIVIEQTTSGDLKDVKKTTDEVSNTEGYKARKDEKLNGRTVVNLEEEKNGLVKIKEDKGNPTNEVKQPSCESFVMTNPLQDGSIEISYIKKEILEEKRGTSLQLSKSNQRKATENCVDPFLCKCNQCRENLENVSSTEVKGSTNQKYLKKTHLAHVNALSESKTFSPIKSKYTSVIPKQIELNLPVRVNVEKPRKTSLLGSCKTTNSSNRVTANLKDETRCLSPQLKTLDITFQNEGFCDADENKQSVVHAVDDYKSSQSFSSQSICISSLNSNVSFQSTDDQMRNQQIGKLPDEIVAVLKEQASNCRTSSLGNSDSSVLSELSAEGKPCMFSRSENLSATDFMKERVSMWKKRLLRKSNLSPTSTGHSSESVDLQNNLLAGQATPKSKIPVRLTTTETSKITPKNIRSIQTQPSLHLNVKGYGPSTSKTPDIYDEYARKGNCKVTNETRKESVWVKQNSFPKENRYNCQPICSRKKPQKWNETLSCSAPLSMYAVTYMSPRKVDTQKEQFTEMSSEFLTSDNQLHTHSNFSELPNLAFSSQVKRNDKHALFNTNTSCPVCKDPSIAQSLSHFSGEKLQRSKCSNLDFSDLDQNHRAKSAPVSDLRYQSVSTANECEHRGKIKSSNNKLLTRSFAGSHESTLNSTKEQIEAFIIEGEGITNQDSLQNLSLLEKMEVFVHQISADKNETQSETCQNQDKQTKSDRLFANADDSGIRAEDNLDDSLENIKKERAYLSKIDSQIYYRIPCKDEIYPVTENTVVPKNAEFFLLSKGHLTSTARVNPKKFKTNFSAEKESDINKTMSETDVNFEMLLKTSLNKQSFNAEEKKTDNDRKKPGKSSKPCKHPLKLPDCNKSYGNISKENTDFKEIVENKRATSKQIQSYLADKKYWNSAQTDEYMDAKNLEKEGNNMKKEQVIEYLKFDGTVVNNINTTNGNSNKVTKKNSKGRPKSSFVGRTMLQVVEKPRPKTGIRRAKEKRNLRNDRLKGETNADLKDSSIGYQHNIDIDHRSENLGRAKKIQDNDDCSYQIYSALRRLSIKNSPNKTESALSKKAETRQRLLRSHVNKNILGKNQNITKNQNTSKLTENNNKIKQQKSKNLSNIKYIPDYEDDSRLIDKVVTNPFDENSKSEAVIIEKVIPQEDCFVSIEGYTEEVETCENKQTIDSDIQNIFSADPEVNIQLGPSVPEEVGNYIIQSSETIDAGKNSAVKEEISDTNLDRSQAIFITQKCSSLLLSPFEALRQPHEIPDYETSEINDQISGDIVEDLTPVYSNQDILQNQKNHPGLLEHNQWDYVNDWINSGSNQVVFQNTLQDDSILQTDLAVNVFHGLAESNHREPWSDDNQFCIEESPSKTNEVKYHNILSENETCQSGSREYCCFSPLSKIQNSLEKTLTQENVDESRSQTNTEPITLMSNEKRNVVNTNSKSSIKYVEQEHVEENVSSSSESILVESHSFKKKKLKNKAYDIVWPSTSDINMYLKDYVSHESRSEKIPMKTKPMTCFRENSYQSMANKEQETDLSESVCHKSDFNEYESSNNTESVSSGDESNESSYEEYDPSQDVSSEESSSITSSDTDSVRSENIDNELKELQLDPFENNLTAKMTRVKSCLSGKYKQKKKVNLKVVRNSFKKKYDIKGCPSKDKSKKITDDMNRELDQRQCKYIRKDEAGKKQREKSIVRVFCLNNKKSKSDIAGEIIENKQVGRRLPLKSKKNSKGQYKHKIKESSQIHSNKKRITRSESKNSFSSNQQLVQKSYKNKVQSSSSESSLMSVFPIPKDKKSYHLDNCCPVEIETSNSGQDETPSISNNSKKKKRQKRKMKTIPLDRGSPETEKHQTENMHIAKGFIQTQEKYYQIITHTKQKAADGTNESIASEGPVRDKVLELPGGVPLRGCRVELSSGDPERSGRVELPAGVPVRGDRVITKAIAEAEKALEGTGKLTDSDDSDTGVVIEDLVNSCRYQLIEDEDKLQLGGIAYFKDYALPFVYINGYKYTPLKDVLTIFQPGYCVGQCTIPRKVLQKHKPLIKTFSTWDQVYKFELIKMKQRPTITTGDTLIKLDCLLSQLQDLISAIMSEHSNTTLKRSQNCPVASYTQLLEKLT